MTRPIFARFPGLRVAHEELAPLPTPVEPLGPGMWVKRDDLAGGGKARKLEFFVPRARGRPLVAVGPEGSNWLLGLAAAGLCVRALTFPQCLNADAARNRRRLRAALGLGCAAGFVVRALAELPRLAGGRSALAPFGGTDAVTTLGFVNAAFELLSDLDPDAVYVPLGTGGTAAGLALGLALAGSRCVVKAVRITTRAIANAWRARTIAASASRLLGVPPPPLRIDVVHAFAGRGYARPHPAAERAKAGFPLPLDSTYSAKAAAAFLAGDEPRRVLWLTCAPPTEIGRRLP